MNKKELITHLTSTTKFNEKDAKLAVEALFLSISKTLLNQEDVSIHGFGTFKLVRRNPKKGTHPTTKKPVQHRAKYVPVFRPSKPLKDSAASIPSA